MVVRVLFSRALQFNLFHFFDFEIFFTCLLRLISSVVQTDVSQVRFPYKFV